MTRMLYLTGLTLLLALPVAAQSSADGPRFRVPTEPIRIAPDTTRSPFLRRRLLRILGALPIATAQPQPGTETACPMPVSRSAPVPAESMPVVRPDSLVAPAANPALVLPRCHNELFADGR